MLSTPPAGPDQAPNLAAAMRAGIAEEELRQGSVTPPVVDLPHIAAAPQLPFYRQTGRRALRLLRPFVLPLLTRLQGRVRAGVDDSDTARRSIMALEGLDATRAETARVAQHLSDIDARTTKRLAGVETAVAERLADTETAVAERLTGMEHAMAASLTAIEARLAGVETAVAERLADTETTVAERLAGMEHAMAAGLTAIEARLAGVETAVAERLADTETAVAERLTGMEHAMAAGLTAIEARLAAPPPRQPPPRAVALGAEVLVRTPHGWLLLPAEDLRTLAAMVETHGELEPGTARVVQALLEPGDFAVDAGANVGMLTLAMAQAVGAAGHVLAIEPTPRLAALLRRSATLTFAEGVIAVEACALGAEPGTAILSIGQTCGHNSLLPLPDATGSVSVPVRRLDDILPPGAQPALVKLDVEGFELEVWKGMAGTIAATPDLAVIVEFGPSHLARAGIAIADWIGTFAASGFTPWEIAEETGDIRPLRTDGLDRVFSMNLLLLRADSARWPRLRRT